MKKILCLLMAVTMILSMLAGCQNSQNEASLYNPDIKIGDTGGLKMPLTKTGEEITWSVTSAEANLNDSYIVKKLREITGVNVKLEVFPVATAVEKLNVLIAANQIPDIIGNGLDQSMADDLSVQGAFAAVEDYVDKLPNFKKTFVDNKDNDWIFKSYAAPDGKLYGYYGYDYNRDINTSATMYRKDVFDKHGLKMWNTPDEFYQTLKKLKELYPSSTPYTTKSGDGVFGAWSTSWGMVAHNPYYDEEEKVWKFTDVAPEYKEMLDFMKKLYHEGLIDPEFITNTQPLWTSKMTQAEKAFVTTDWIGRMEMFKEQTKETVPDYDLRFANPMGPKGTMKEPQQVCWARYVANNDKAELAFKLLDFCLSPAGKELITMGIEGETYTIGEDGMADYIEFPDVVPATTELEAKYGMFIEGMYLSFDRRSSYFQFSEREQEAQEFAKDKSNLEPIDPILVYTDEEKEIKNRILADFDKAGKEFATKYVLNNLGDKEWNEWLKKAENLGYKDLVKVYNDAQKRFDAE